MTKSDEKCPHGDEVFLGPKLPGDGHLAIRHTSDHTTTPCVAIPVVEGRPVVGEVVSLERIEGERYAVKGSYRAPEGRGANGPAKVTSDAYRDGWDKIFKKEDLN